ncbi:MAG: hypothetical protein HRT37_24795 [Alteromonadaceae bacterium]|nr:hypothetical protein [Alteromonadaceae bacterium]
MILIATFVAIVASIIINEPFIDSKSKFDEMAHKVKAEAELVGSYSTDTDHEYNHLTLYSSRKFSHEYKDIDSDLIIRQEGKWEAQYKPNSRDVIFVFSQFDFWKGAESPSESDGWVPVINKSLGTLDLCFDLNISTSEGCFSKKD